MPDVFVSYTTADVRLARYVRDHLARHGLDVFLARVSLAPGTLWTPAIWEALMKSRCVLFRSTALSWA